MLAVIAQQTKPSPEGAAIGGVLLLGLVCVGAVFYFIPAVVAMMRGHQNTAAIVVLNVLTGWTFIGYVVALVWAFTEVRKPRYRSAASGGDGGNFDFN